MQSIMQSIYQIGWLVVLAGCMAGSIGCWLNYLSCASYSMLVVDLLSCDCPLAKPTNQPTNQPSEQVFLSLLLTFSISIKSSVSIRAVRGGRWKPVCVIVISLIVGCLKTATVYTDMDMSRVGGWGRASTCMHMHGHAQLSCLPSGGWWLLTDCLESCFIHLPCVSLTASQTG